MRTKLGLHLTTGSRDGYGPVVAAAPAVVLSIGDSAPLKEAWEKSQGRTITIYRDMKVYDNGNAPHSFPQMTEEEARAAADHYWPQLRAQYEKNAADYYQPTNEIAGGLNEPEGSDAFKEALQSTLNLIAYETRLMELTEAEGGRFKLAIASLAGATPGPFELWKQLFVPLIRRAGEGGHIYSRHAYGPGLLTKAGPASTDGNAGRPFLEAQYLREHGIHTPMIITEAGPNAGYEFPGVADFMEDVIRYDQLCQQHDNIWGFCCWTYGDWRDGKPNIQAASGALEIYLNQQGGAVRSQYPGVTITGGFPPQPESPPLGGEWQAPSEPLVKGWIWVKQVERRGELGRVHSNRLKLREEPNNVTARTLGLVPIGTIARITGEAQGNAPLYYPVEVSKAELEPLGSPAPVSPQPVTPVTPSIPGNGAKAQLQIGMHDLAGADWMKDHGLKGWTLHSIAFKRDATREDFRHYEDAGIKVLMRLNYGYEPEGNVPLPDMADYEPFIDAVARTIRDSQGVWGWIIGNETNNAMEWPGGPKQGKPITAQHYVELYNRIYSQKPPGTRLGPQAIDPYHPRSGDSRVYWKQILDGIEGAEFLTIHPKTQDSNPDNIDSGLTFSDDPLIGMFQHLRSYQPLLDLVPPRFRHLPVIGTEVNPQRRDDGTLGWQDERGPEWVRRATAHFHAYNATARQPVTGVIFYRYEDADHWQLRKKPPILDAIRQFAAA